MRVGRRFVVSGRVQGVGFRYFAAESAHVEGIQGWVGNLADGTVEVVAEGDDEAMARFEVRIRRGPPGARVTSVFADEQPPSGHLDGFRIQG